jgi:hypothetical protein
MCSSRTRTPLFLSPLSSLRLIEEPPNAVDIVGRKLQLARGEDRVELLRAVRPADGTVDPREDLGEGQRRQVDAARIGF